jgi:glycosyltransferase involved in cell wall biosynthesis
MQSWPFPHEPTAMKTVPTLPTTVLMIGPPPEMVGGMGAVVGQMMRLDFAGRYRMEFLPITVSPQAGESRVGRVARHCRQRHRLSNTIRQVCPSIVHIHTCSGFSFHRSAWDMRVASRRGCRTVLHMHGAQFGEYFADAGALEQRLVRSALSSADRVVALSENWRVKLRAISPTARVVVVENAVETIVPRNGRPRGAACRFLILARMDEWKGIDDLLDACVLLHRRGVAFELTLAGPAGTSGDAESIGRKIYERGIDRCVRYVGVVQGEAKAALLAEADVYVQPSRQEGMPIAVLEAMAWGLPVVATRAGAMAEVIEDDVQGLLVPTCQPVALASAMGTLAFDLPRRAAMGEAARTLATTRFGLTRLRDDLVSLYDEVMRERSAQAADGTRIPRAAISRGSVSERRAQIR